MRAAKILTMVLLVTGTLWIYGSDLKNYGSEAIPIKYVRTEGRFQYLSKDEIKTALQPLVKTGFFSADMRAIQLAVLQLPWVDSVTVKRIWPDALDIKVREKKPYVRWGQQSLLNERGEIFTPKNAKRFQALPLLTGPALQQKKVLEIMKGVKTALSDQALELVEFCINDRWAWRIRLASGMEILLGRNEQLKKLQRFLKTLPVLGQERVNTMAIVDLRYPNGYAVSWKPGSEEIDWKNMAKPQNENNAQVKKGGRK